MTFFVLLIIVIIIGVALSGGFERNGKGKIVDSINKRLLDIDDFLSEKVYFKDIRKSINNLLNENEVLSKIKENIINH